MTLRADVRRDLARREKRANISSDKECPNCGRKKRECGLKNCERHFHSVEVKK